MGGRQVLRLLVDLGVPVVLFYVLRAAGVEVLPALVASALVPTVSVGVQLARRHELDGLGIAVAATALATAGLSLWSGSPRVALARDGWLTLAWGLAFLASLAARRPLTYTFARPLLEGRRVWAGRRGLVAPRPEPWDEIYETEPRFRRAWRATTVVWAVAFALDAVARFAIAAWAPLDAAPALAAALWPVTLLALQVVTNVQLAVSGFWRTLAAPVPLR
jgi:hypothetical protein